MFLTVSQPFVTKTSYSPCTLETGGAVHLENLWSQVPARVAQNPFEGHFDDQGLFGN